VQPYTAPHTPAAAAAVGLLLNPLTCLSANHSVTRLQLIGVNLVRQRADPRVSVLPRQVDLVFANGSSSEALRGRRLHISSTVCCTGGWHCCCWLLELNFL
jgi:hypothetical protein